MVNDDVLLRRLGTTFENRPPHLRARMLERLVVVFPSIANCALRTGANHPLGAIDPIGLGAVR